MKVLDNNKLITYLFIIIINNIYFQKLFVIMTILELFRSLYDIIVL